MAYNTPQQIKISLLQLAQGGSTSISGNFGKQDTYKNAHMQFKPGLKGLWGCYLASLSPTVLINSCKLTFLQIRSHFLFTPDLDRHGEIWTGTHS